MVIQSKQRNSSIELFRIIAMLLVVIVHFNGWFVGGMPTKFNYNDISSFRINQVFIESMSCVAVNCFLLISGYFGIKFMWHKIWNIFVLLLFIKVPFAMFDCWMNHSFNFAFFQEIFAISRSGYFIENYIMLCFFAPVLNAFIDRYGKKIHKFVVVFWLIEIWFGFILNDEDFAFNEGYSLIHFVLMYFLGRTIFLNKDSLLKIKCFYSWGAYLVCIIVVSVMYLLKGDKAYWYNNPIVVLESIFLFFPFIHYQFYSKQINWIACSTFSVYILSTRAYSYLSQLDLYILHSYSYSHYLMIITGIIFAVYIFSILYDKVRLVLFGRLTDNIYNLIEHKILKTQDYIS